MIADGQTGRLLRCALANAAALGLDDTQVAALARLHWGGAPPGGVVAAMLAVMSESQFCETVSRLTEVPEQQVPLDTKAIESAVAAAVDKRSKDRSLVETELATAAAEKVLGWAKLFATFVAVPVGVLLLILTFFGISKFEDITRVSNQADTLVAELRTKLAEGTAQFDSIKTKIDGLTGQLDNTRSTLERQLADVKQFTTKNEDNIMKLSGNVNNLSNSVTNLQSASTSLLLGASGKSVEELQSRLKELGFFQGEPDGTLGPSTVEAVKAFQTKNGLIPDGIVGAQTRALLFKS